MDENPYDSPTIPAGRAANKPSIRRVNEVVSTILYFLVVAVVYVVFGGLVIWGLILLWSPESRHPANVPSNLVIRRSLDL